MVEQKGKFMWHLEAKEFWNSIPGGAYTEEQAEEKWEALPPTLPRRVLQALFGRTFTKLVGPPGLTTLAWGGSAAQWAHARLEDAALRDGRSPDGAV